MNRIQIFLSSVVIGLTLSSCVGKSLRIEPMIDQTDSVRQDALYESDQSNGNEPSFSKPSSSRTLIESPGDRDIDKAYEAGVLIPGMSTQAVTTLLGRPARVEYAGNPKFQNQKWIYPNGLSDRWKLSSPRIVYFEAGRVSGWENMDSARPLFDQ